MKRIILITGMCVFLHVSLSFAAAIPKMINYQGYLADSTGAPLTGAYSMTFRIYDDSTAGNLEWVESQNGPDQNGIKVENGLFNVMLGAVIPLDLPFDEAYWLEVKVGDDVMPRIRFTSVGYAYRSVVADSAAVAMASGTIVFDSLHVTGNTTLDGDVHIGGAIRHDSPIPVYDGLEFLNSAGNVTYHIEIDEQGEHPGTGMPEVMHGAMGFESFADLNPNDMQVVFWDGVEERPSFIISDGGLMRASTFDHSLQVGKALGEGTVDSNYTKFEGYDYIDGDTHGDGADLGVEHEIEAKGSIYAQEDLVAGGGDVTIGDGATAYAGRIVLHDADGTDGFTTSIVSNSDVAADFSLTLPAADGAADQVLTTDGSGNLSWSTGSGSGYWNQSGSDIYYNDGNVGIGESAPAALLHLDTATTSTAQLRLEASTGTDPSSPDTGDLWFNGTNLNFYDGASTTDLITGGAFSTTDSVTSNSPGDLAVDDFVFGSDQLDDSTGTDDDIRMFFDKSKAAFRAGWVTNDEWDDANRGNYSFASGVNTIASADWSTAMGGYTIASGDFSSATGFGTTANGDISFATGFGTTASGDYSTAMGNITTASGWASTAMGWSTVASGQASTAMGYNTLANISYATAMGYQTIASGENSTAMGYRSTAQPYVSVVLGRYNVISGTTDSWVDTDPLFVIGNGADLGNRANAMTVLKNGDVVIGSDSLDNRSGTDDDYRMFFDKSKGAFRAGQVIGSEWDDSFRGRSSFACGWNTTASGDFSTAMGVDATASGDYSCAMGWSTTASEQSSIATGWNTTASGNGATAMGRGTLASGDYSCAMGYETTAQSYLSVHLGRYNVYGGDPNLWVATDRLFVVGNGSGPGSPSNAFEVRKNANIYFNDGTLIHNPSDRRLKKNITDVDDALDKVMRLRGVKFEWKNNVDKGVFYGMIAQEVEEVLPEMVHTGGDGYKTIAWWQLNGVYVGAIQELKARNDALKEQNIARQSRVTELEEENQALRRTMQSIETRLSALETSKLLYQSAIERYKR